jgi:hypothetical protein
MGTLLQRRKTGMRKNKEVFGGCGPSEPKLVIARRPQADAANQKPHMGLSGLLRSALLAMTGLISPG